MNEFIEKYYPKFKEYVKLKGYATCDGVEQIKLWHEFLGLLKERLNAKSK